MCVFETFTLSRAVCLRWRLQGGRDVVREDEPIFRQVGEERPLRRLQHRQLKAYVRRRSEGKSGLPSARYSRVKYEGTGGGDGGEVG